MGLQGKLTKDQFGFSMPVDAPLYTPFPVYYRGVTLYLFTYVTDAESAARLLPAPCELTDPPIAQLVFAKYDFSTVGAYNEVAQTLLCTYRGKPRFYAVRLHVDNAMAMCAGREIGGFPKKMGKITFESGELQYASLESPPGNRLCSCTIAPMQPVPNMVFKPMDFLSLRVMPNPQSPSTPSLMQLIGTQWVLDRGEMFLARGSFKLPDVAVINPYQHLPFLRPLSPAEEQHTELFSQSIFRGEMYIQDVEIFEDL